MAASFARKPILFSEVYSTVLGRFISEIDSQYAENMQYSHLRWGHPKWFSGKHFCVENDILTIDSEKFWSIVANFRLPRQVFDSWRQSTQHYLCMSLLPASIKRVGSKTTEKRWRTLFSPLYVNGGFLLPWKPEFSSNLPQNLMQPFCHPSDTTHKIQLRLADWLQRYSSLKVWTTMDDDDWPLVYYKLTLWAFGSGELKNYGIRQQAVVKRSTSISNSIF